MMDHAAIISRQDGCSDMARQRNLTNAQWAAIEPVVYRATGQKRKAHRAFLDAVFSVLRSGLPWREMSKSHGNWNTVYVKFRRWSTAGIWDKIVPTLVQMGLTRDWQIPYEDSEGFPTTIRIVVAQAREMASDEPRYLRSIQDQVKEWEPYVSGVRHEVDRETRQ